MLYEEAKTMRMHQGLFGVVTAVTVCSFLMTEAGSGVAWARDGAGAGIPPGGGMPQVGGMRGQNYPPPASYPFISSDYTYYDYSYPYYGYDYIPSPLLKGYLPPGYYFGEGFGPGLYNSFYAPYDP
jgi:hypothetical protein